MAKQDVTQLTQFAGHLFERQWPVISLWQTIADHFYPERADFTVTRNVGQELADSLVDSYPILVRRDLGNSFSAMLRDGDWFSVGTQDTPDHAGNMWLDWSTQRLRRLMNERSSNFVRATKEGDHDYAAFGNAVLSVGLNRRASGLIFQSWHLRDCAWFDNEYGQVGGVVRKWKPTFRQLVDYFGEKNVHPNITKMVLKTPFKEADIRHLMIPSNMYGDDQIASKFEWVSLFIDVGNNHLMEEVGMDHMLYVVPRFQTIAGSPYAYSPATVVGLPDARSLQAMTHTLLEAGERYARPPIIATQKVIRGDVDLAPDGITWVDDEYDERLGASLRPLAQERGGFPIGLEMRSTIVETLSSAFYLNKLSLPENGREMTAYEVSERMKQYRRENLPLFAPIESEYNGQLCEAAFNIAMKAGFLGSPYDIPESLQGSDIQFKFISPLSQSEEEEKATRFNQMSGLLREAAEHDQMAAQNIDFDVALRDAITGIGSPTKWLNSMESVISGREQQAQQDQVMQGAEAVNAVAETAINVEAAGG